jgi:hypothetical protein
VRAEGSTFTPGAPQVLFDVRTSSAVTQTYYMYDVLQDGQRFIVATGRQEVETAPVTVVLNWTAGLRK